MKVNKNNADVQLSKNVIRSQMENAFGKLAMVAKATDIEAMQQLLKLVAKANAMAMPFWNDHQLQLDLFDYAFVELPEESRHRFMMEHNSEQPDSEIQRLKWFIQRLVLEHFRVAKVYTWLARPDQNDGKFCNYCKQTDHLYDDCWER